MFSFPCSSYLGVDNADHRKSLRRSRVPPQDSGLWPEHWKVCGEVSTWRLSSSFLSADGGLLRSRTRQPVSDFRRHGRYRSVSLVLTPLCSRSAPSDLLSKNWKTGLRLCPSTRIWASRCQPSWTNFTRLWVGSTGPRTSLRSRAQIRLQTLQRSLLTRLARPKKTLKFFFFFFNHTKLLHLLNCGWKRRNTAVKPSHIWTGWPEVAALVTLRDRDSEKHYG